ncbi:MAG: hypothetical protein CM15mV58_640 [uncultured marine virus]|nr:MAG: hypothetical protein CM15mV58_640 [uncultured marine virus]
MMILSKMGVISGNPAVTGDGAYTKWHLKYLLMIIIIRSR